MATQIHSEYRRERTSDAEKLREAMEAIDGFRKHVDCLLAEVSSRHAINALDEMDEMATALMNNAKPSLLMGLNELGARPMTTQSRMANALTGKPNDRDDGHVHCYRRVGSHINWSLECAIVVFRCSCGAEREEEKEVVVMEDDLKTISAQEVVWKALIELRIAIGQSIDSDDRIIMGHVRQAAAMLETIDTRP